MRLKDSDDPAARRVFMLCVDAMSLDFVRAHPGELPFLTKMLSESVFRPLTSPADHASASVWPTFAAADDPGVHGHYFPFQWNPAAMHFERSLGPEFSPSLGFVPFWRTLARDGIPCIAFDAGVPIAATDAPCPEITNWSYQSSGAATASDPALLREIRRRFGRRPIGKEVPVPKTLRQSRKIRDDMIRAIGKKTEATLWLTSRFDWRLFLAGFYEIHRAGHNLLVVPGDFASAADPGALLEVYKAQDRACEKIAHAIDDGRTALILFSLHGMGRNRAQDHLLDEILARLNAVWRESRGAPAAPKKPPGFIAALRAHVPYGLQYSLAYLLGETVQDWVVNRTLTGGRDWGTTPSFRLLSGGEAFIRFNLKGRERDGYFDPDGEEFSTYGRWIKERLLEIRVTETGEALFGNARDVSGIFPGSRVGALPDMILAYGAEAPAASVHSSALGEITGKLQTGRGGNHTGEAFMVATGAGAEAIGDVADIKDLKRLAEQLLVSRPTMSAARVGEGRSHAHA